MNLNETIKALISIILEISLKKKIDENLIFNLVDIYTNHAHFLLGNIFWKMVCLVIQPI